jgi:hypothetical protein
VAELVDVLSVMLTFRWRRLILIFAHVSAPMVARLLADAWHMPSPYTAGIVVLQFSASVTSRSSVI